MRLSILNPLGSHLRARRPLGPIWEYGDILVIRQPPFLIPLHPALLNLGKRLFCRSIRRPDRSTNSKQWSRRQGWCIHSISNELLLHSPRPALHLRIVAAKKQCWTTVIIEGSGDLDPALQGPNEIFVIVDGFRDVKAYYQAWRMPAGHPRHVPYGRMAFLCRSIISKSPWLLKRLNHKFFKRRIREDWRISGKTCVVAGVNNKWLIMRIDEEAWRALVWKLLSPTRMMRPSVPQVLTTNTTGPTRILCPMLIWIIKGQIDTLSWQIYC